MKDGKEKFNNLRIIEIEYNFFDIYETIINK